jgi:hypothetical protein
LSDFNVVVRGSFEGSGDWNGTGWAKVDADALRITAARERELVIPAGRVGRIRFAHFPSTSTTRAGWETKIWPQGAGKPLLILATPEKAGQYGTVMREFAARVAECGGLERITRGPGLATAIVNFALSGCSMMALAILCVIFAIWDRSWWMWLIAAVATLTAGGLVISLVRNHWPRRIASLDELADMLPAR